MRPGKERLFSVLKLYFKEKYLGNSETDGISHSEF